MRSADVPSRPVASEYSGLRGVRLLVAAYLIVAYGGVVRYQLASQGQPEAVLEASEYAAAGVAIGLMLWMPAVGAVVGLIALMLPMVAGPTWADLPTVMAAILLVIARCPRRRWVILAPYVAFVANVALTQPREISLLYLAAVAVSSAAGAGIRVALAASARRDRRAAELRREAARAGTAERERLAAALEQAAADGITGIERDADISSSNPADLDAALNRVGEQARTSLHEIRRLVSGLRSQSPEEAPAPPSRITMTGKQIGRTATTLVCIGVAISVIVAGPGTPAATATAVVSCFAAITLVWAPAAGSVLTLLTLAAALAGHAEEPELLMLLLIASVLAPMRVRNRRARLAILAGELVFCFAWGTVHINDSFGDALRALTAVTMGWGIGLTVRYFTDGRRRELATLEEADARRLEAQRAERDELARELHDSVAHHLSLVSLQVLAHGGSDDVHELRDALQRCQRYADRTRSELTWLVTTVAGAPIDTMTGPRATVAALKTILVERGHKVSTLVTLAPDPLDVRVRLTLVRILQEACTNVLRYARESGTCSINVLSKGGTVDVRVISQLPDTPQDHDLSSGWGLRGLAERAELLGGHLEAGQEQDNWVVRAELPMKSEPLAQLGEPALSRKGAPGGGG